MKLKEENEMLKTTVAELRTALEIQRANCERLKKLLEKFENFLMLHTINLYKKWKQYKEMI